MQAGEAHHLIPLDGRAAGTRLDDALAGAEKAGAGTF